MAADPRETSFFRALNLSEGVTGKHSASYEWRSERLGGEEPAGTYLPYQCVFSSVSHHLGIVWNWVMMDMMGEYH